MKARRPSTIPQLPLAEHQGKPCPYCGKEMIIGTLRRPTREHMHPRHLGGKLVNGNRLIVCSPCNNDKGPLTLEQFAHKLTAKGDQRAARVWAVLENVPASADVLETRKIVQGWEKAAASASPHGLAVIPYEESMMIMRHGKAHWREWKESGNPICDCCQRPQAHKTPRPGP